MKFLQNEDKDLAREKELLKAGQAPGNGDKVEVKRYLQKTHNLTLAKDGCIISLKRNRKNLEERTYCHSRLCEHWSSCKHSHHLEPSLPLSIKQNHGYSLLYFGQRQKGAFYLQKLFSLLSG